MALITSAIEMYLSGSWTDVTSDVRILNPIHAKRGFNGATPIDRVAPPGTLSFALDNSEGNSGGKLGYYSPDNSNVRAGFDIGTKVRLKLTAGATTRYVWYGLLTSVKPAAGRYAGRYVICTASDYMSQFSVHKLKLIQVQVNKRDDQILSTIVSNLPIAPLNTSYATGVDVFPYSLHDVQDENTYAITALQKISQSGDAYIFVKGNGTDGETLVLENRHTRATRLVSSATLNDAMDGLDISRSADNIYGTVVCTVNPAKIDTAAVVLASLGSEITLFPGASNAQTFTMRFTDPSGQSVRVAALAGSEVTPVADTDYKMSSISGDGGNNLNSSLSITVTWGGNSASVTIQNTGSVTGYVSRINLRAKGIYLYNSQDVSSSDSTSQNTYGDRVLSVNLAYQSSSNVGRDFSTAWLRQSKAPFSTISSVAFKANRNSTLAGYAANNDIGDRITMIETVTGISADYFISSVDYSIDSQLSLSVRWGLEPADTASYFVLNQSQLNGSDVLGF